VLASPVTDDDGKVVSVVELWRDITQRIRDEEQLAAVERLSSLAALASGLAHEMNTPLASMLTCAEGLLGRVDESGQSGPLEPQREAIRESADVIRQQVLRCRKATEQFRRFTRGIPPSVEPLDLRQAVEGVVSLVAPTARDAHVAVELEGAADIPPVRANPELVQHVVLNLLINAVQSFGPEGGRVVVTLETLDDVRIRVTDTGSGIAARAREHLFEPFRSAKLHGTGLGLFLSRSFMRRFGGDVRVVETMPGQGSCFEVVFRRAGGLDS
jgi:two-component system NtrC family sensor kinase